MIAPILFLTIFGFVFGFHIHADALPRISGIAALVFGILILIHRVPLLTPLLSLCCYALFLLVPLRAKITPLPYFSELEYAGFMILVLSAFMRSRFPLQELKEKISLRLSVGSSPILLSLSLVLSDLRLWIQFALVLLVGMELSHLLEMGSALSLPPALMLDPRGITLLVIAYLCVLRREWL